MKNNERILKMKTFKKFLIVIVSVISLMSCSVTALAEEDWESRLGTIIDGSVLINGNESSGTSQQITRGYYLADGSSYISDKGNNVIYISGSTSCYRTADELIVNVFLQRLVGDDWEMVTYQYHTEYDTYYAHNGFFITVTPGYYYRTVSTHAAIKGDVQESMSTKTDWLYIG